MRLHVTALALAAGILWGGAVFLVSLAHWIWPDYGAAFLNLAASIYPGYEPDSTVGSVLIGTLYGLVDGAIGGAVFAWLYNLFAGHSGE